MLITYWHTVHPYDDHYIVICLNICFGDLNSFNKLQTERKDAKKNQLGYTQIKKFKTYNILHIFLFYQKWASSVGMYVLFLLFLVCINQDLLTKEDDTMFIVHA